jgi:hypothetical protein
MNIQPMTFFMDWPRISLYKKSHWLDIHPYVEIKLREMIGVDQILLLF